MTPYTDEMSDADRHALQLAIADAGLTAIGWALDAAARDGVAAFVADPVPYFARGLAHFRIGLLGCAAAQNWDHRQRFFLVMYACAPVPLGGDERFILNMAETVAAWGADQLTRTQGPGFTPVHLATPDIIATADKLQSAVANDLQAHDSQGAGGCGHGRGEKFATFRLTMQDN